MYRNEFIFKFILILMLFILPVSSFGFVEQVLSFQDKFQTSVGIFRANSRFAETTDEKESDEQGLGFFGELNLRRTPWALRLDTFSIQRETGNKNFGVTNNYREFRIWGLGFYEFGDVFSLYGGLGAGLIYPTTKLSVSGSSETLSGRSNTTGSCLLGMRVRTPVSVFFDILYQTTFAPVYPTGSLNSLTMALGYQF